MPAPRLDEWIALMRAFVEGSLAPDDFDTTYFAYFREANRARNEGEPWVTPAHAGARRRRFRRARRRGPEDVPSEFFVEVDRLSNDPDLFPDFTVTPDELRETARGVIAELEQIRDEEGH